ncbi:MAG: helix-hairpin-helix domain-containing protein [Syntrophothermus sp.]
MRKYPVSTTQIKDYFTFNRTEQRGLFVLITLLIVIVTTTQLLSHNLENKTYNPASSEKEILEFEKMIARADSLQETAYRNKEKKYGGRYFSVKWDTARKLFKKDNFIIELNGADTFELQRLSGIGPGFARRIVKYRERLGGFISVDQVKEVFGMDEERFEMIREHLVVNPDSVHPIDINQVTFKDLLKHPYFPFGITKPIMIYRKDHKIIKSTDELRNISGINDSVFKKIIPYVKVN